MAPDHRNLIPSVELQEHLERLAAIVTKPKGTVLFRRGDPVLGIFLIRSGEVSLALDCESPVYPTRYLRAGCVVGMPAAISGTPYSLTAEVTEDAELGFVSRQDVTDCLRTNPAWCFQVMEMLSSEISGIRSAFKASDPVFPARCKSG